MKSFGTSVCVECTTGNYRIFDIRKAKKQLATGET